MRILIHGKHPILLRPKIPIHKKVNIMFRRKNASTPARQQAGGNFMRAWYLALFVWIFPGTAQYYPM